MKSTFRFLSSEEFPVQQLGSCNFLWDLAFGNKWCKSLIRNQLWHLREFSAFVLSDGSVTKERCPVPTAKAKAESSMDSSPVRRISRIEASFSYWCNCLHSDALFRWGSLAVVQ